MRKGFLFLVFSLVSLTFAEPITSLWRRDIQAEGGNTNGKELLLWGNNEVHKIDPSGKILWKRSFRDLQQAFLLPDGQVLVLTRKGNDNELHFLNLSGYDFWQFSCNKVVSIASRDKKVALITAKGELYIFTLKSSPGRLKGWRRYNFHKSLRALAILQDGVIALAMPEQMCIFEEGKQPLFFPFPNIQRIIPLDDGGFLTFTPQSGKFSLSRHTRSGYLAWRKEFEGEARSLLSLSPFYSLSIQQKIGKDMEERKLLVLEQNGTIRWQRGGLLFKPLPLFLTSKGELLCTDEEKDKLLLFDQKGRFIWQEKSRDQIIRSIPFYPSSVLLLYEKGVEFLEVRTSIG